MCAVIHLIVAEVTVYGLMFLVGPNNRVVPAGPNLTLVSAHRETGLVDGGQDLDVRVLAQVVLPGVPLVGAALELGVDALHSRVIWRVDMQLGLRWLPRVGPVGTGAVQGIIVPWPLIGVVTPESYVESDQTATVLHKVLHGIALIA